MSDDDVVERLRTGLWVTPQVFTAEEIERLQGIYHTGRSPTLGPLVDQDIPE